MGEHVSSTSLLDKSPLEVWEESAGKSDAEGSEEEDCEGEGDTEDEEAEIGHGLDLGQRPQASDSDVPVNAHLAGRWSQNAGRAAPPVESVSPARGTPEPQTRIPPRIAASVV